jgi:hypothetical protein
MEADASNRARNDTKPPCSGGDETRQRHYT